MKNLFIILLSIVMTTPAFAGHGKQQGNKTMEERAASKLEYLTIVLDLTDVQLTDIRTLQSDHMLTMNSIKEKYQPLLDEMKSELEGIRLENKDKPGTWEQAKEKAHAVREKYDPQLKPMRDALKEEKSSFDDILVTIFNSQQQEKFEALTAWKEQNRPKMKHHDHEGGMHAPFKMHPPHEMHRPEK